MKKKIFAFAVLFVFISVNFAFISHSSVNATAASWYYKPDSYDQLVSWYKNLEEKYPGYIEVFKANEMYGTGKAGDYDIYYVRITNESRGLHKPEVLFLGSPHGDETAGTVGMYWFADWLMRNAFEKNNDWLKWLIDHREIYLAVSQNPYGFDHNQRTDIHNWDLNREADYDGPGRFGPPECWGSVNGKTLREFVDHHLIRIGTDFHGGARMLLYPWSSTHKNVKATSPLSGKEYYYAPPDFYFYDAACLRLGSYMGNFGGELNANNIGTIPTTVGYEAAGAIAAWAYGSDVEKNPAEREFVKSEEGYPGTGIFWISPELSVIKNPSEWKFGNDNLPGYGTEVRRFLLHQIDLAQPYVRWINPPEIAAENKITLRWQVNGSMVVDHTSIQWGTDPDAINNSAFFGHDHNDFDGQYVGGTGWDNAADGKTHGKIWEEEITLPEGATDIYVVAKAQVDQIYANIVAPEIYGAQPYLRIIKERTNSSYHEVINGTDGVEKIEGRLWWYSPVIHIRIGGIKRPAEGYLYLNDREIIPTFSGNTVILGKITAEAGGSCFDKVEFYVDGILKKTVDSQPYQWLWDEKVAGKHVIEVKMYGEKVCEDRREVTIFNIGS